MSPSNLPSFLEKCRSFQELAAAVTISDRQRKVLATEMGFDLAHQMLTEARARFGNVYVVGNGGSAAIASHIVNDFVNVGGLRAAVLHDAALMTCMSNDYGYEHAYARMLATMARPGDCLVAISSSGNSLNIRHAAVQMHRSQGQVITLSGFKTANELRGLGDLNLWLDSCDYGLVEVGHLFLLHHMADRLRLEREAE